VERRSPQPAESTTDSRGGDGSDRTDVRPELPAGRAPSEGAGFGDAAHLVEIHARYRRRLEAVAFRVLRDRDEAEDVVARVFEALPQARYRGQSSLWTYLYRAATNGAVTVLRKRRRREHLEEELRARVELDAVPARGGLGDAEASVLEGEILSAVASALLDVKPQHRRALVLRIVWGLTNTEIAAHEGVPLPTVGTWLRRGREELRVRLDSLLRDLGRGGERE
jgi:RNA polymerase sigma-70 factor (ECF subfamily)